MPAGATIWEAIGTEDDFGVYELCVQDSGIGMSVELCDRMFNAFERERTSTASGVEGTGLGLAITRGIVDSTVGRVVLDKVAASSPGRFDIILMGTQMPNMDGHEAASAIRSLGDEALSAIPIVAVTANAFREDEEAAADAGMRAHVAKPLDIERAMEALTRVLGAGAAD